LLPALGWLVACGENPESPDPPAGIDGDWHYGESFSDPVHQITCTDTGAISITQAGSLNLITTLMLTGYSFGPSVLAPDGTVAYAGTDFGYIKLHLPDAAVLEAVRLPGRPATLDLLPDGLTLVARTDQPGFSSPGSQLFLVDLR
jgi:hypothetical protein